MALHVGDIGFEIFLATGVDLAGASSVKIRFRRPDNSEGEWAATAGTKDAVFGLRHITLASEINQAGTWHFQAEVNGLAGFTGTSTKATLQVERPLPGV